MMYRDNQTVTKPIDFMLFVFLAFLDKALQPLYNQRLSAFGKIAKTTIRYFLCAHVA